MQTCKLNTEKAPGNATPSIPWKNNCLAAAQVIHHGVNVQENCTEQGHGGENPLYGEGSTWPLSRFGVRSRTAGKVQLLPIRDLGSSISNEPINPVQMKCSLSHVLL